MNDLTNPAQHGFASADDWKDDFKRRLAISVVEHVRGERLVNRELYQIKRTIHLPDEEDDLLQRLFFGHLRTVENSDLYDRFADDSFQRAKHIVQGAIQTVLKPWHQELGELAEALRTNPVALTASLIEDDDLTPGELDLELCSYVFEYKGHVSGSTQSTFSLTTDIGHEAFWSMLDTFQINASDMAKVLTQNLDQEGKAAFSDAFAKHQEEAERQRLKSLDGHGPLPVLDPEQLVRYIDANANVKGAVIEAWLRFALDPTTLNDFSRTLSDNEMGKFTTIHVHSGFLSPHAFGGSHNPHEHNVVDLQAPFPLQVKDLGVTNYKPVYPEHEHDADVLGFDPWNNLRLQLQAVFNEGMQNEVPSQGTTRWLNEILEASPPWMVQAHFKTYDIRLKHVKDGVPGDSKQAIDNLANTGHATLAAMANAIGEHLQRKAQTTPSNHLDVALMTILESVGPHRMTSDQRDQLAKLIDQGARCHLVNGAGVNAFMLACARNAPRELIDKLLDVTPDPHLRLNDGRNAFALHMEVIASSLSVAERIRSDGEHKTEWFLDQGLGYPVDPIDNKPGFLNDAMAHLSHFSDGRIALRVLNYNAPDMHADTLQEAKDELVHHAMFNNNAAVLSAALGNGGSVDGHAERTGFAPLEMMGQSWLASGDTTQKAEAEDCLRMVAAARSKELAISVLKGLLDTGPALRP